MVDSKHDVISKPEKHDWTFFAFFAIALILIASAIVWATAKAGLFNSNAYDDDTPQRVSLPAIPMPAAPEQSSDSSDAESPGAESQSPGAITDAPGADSEASSADSAVVQQSPGAGDAITPSAGAPASNPEN